jgi:hypothetical protein
MSDYAVEPTIGRGSYGAVFKGRRVRRGPIAAVKKLKPCGDCLQRARRSQEAERAELFQEDPESAGPRHDLPAAPGWRVRERDVNTVRSNAETFNGRGSFTGRIAQNIAWRFQRLKRPLGAYSVAGWTKHICGPARSAMRCPPLLRSMIPHSLDNAMPVAAPFSGREMHDYILTTCEGLTDPRDIEHVVAILRKNDPPIQVDAEFLVVDVSALSVNSEAQLQDKTLFARAIKHRDQTRGRSQ